MLCRWWALLCLVPAIAAASATVQTPGERWWGVIVGVGQYQHLDPSLALEGPPNDVPLVVNWLHRQGVPRRHLTVLADQVRRADGLPTRAAILDALQSLSLHMQSGDVAFLYFAGHGSQQPQGGAQWSKADGLDEIFLPRDVGRWDAASGGVEGAIVGREIGAIVDALRARGIFVWLVFDSCHSATIARTLMFPQVRSRAVPPSQLGVPNVKASQTPETGGGGGRLIKVQGAELAGGYVAFYASQTVESAPELALPPGEPGRQVHGLFTYALLNSLNATGAGSYREVSHRILAYYASTYPATTPEFEGALDGPIGTPSAPLLPPSAWPAQRSGASFRIDSGRLNGITPESLLALYAAIPASKNTEPIALLRVNRVTLTSAWADPVKDPLQLKAWHISADRSEEIAAGVVRILLTGVDTAVRMAGPAACFASLPAPYGCDPQRDARSDGASLALATQLTAQPGCLPPGTEFTSDIGAADLLLLTRDQRLFVVQFAAKSLDHAVAVDLRSPEAAAELRGVLFKATRAVALMRLARDFPGAQDELLADVSFQEPDRVWRPVTGQRTSEIPFDADLRIQLQNRGDVDLDVTVLEINDGFGIEAVYPIDGETNLLRRGSAIIDVRGSARPAGENQLVLITEKARAGRPHDLSYLAQPGAARHGTDTGLAALLERFGFSARGTRSAVSEDDRQSASIKVIRYEVATRP
jgi:hypothetical protein